MLDVTASGADARKRLVVLHGDVTVGGTALMTSLREAGLEAIELPERDGIDRISDSLPGPPDLLVVTLHGERFGLLRDLRSNARGWKFPVLGIARLGELDTDVGLLRAHGVVGVIDARTRPEAAVARILRLLQLGPCGLQGSERVSCTFPVGVTVGRIRRRREFSLNLSATGMRITSGLPIELNARIALRFRLPMVARRAIEAEARVVHRTTHRNTWGRWEIGVFFFAIEEPDREIVGQEVIRLLTHSPH